MNIPLFYRSRSRSARQGFTLMEMIIVLSIIALLMGMVIFNISDFSVTAKEKKVQGDLITFNEMLSAYELESGTLPTTDQGIKALWSKPTTEPVPDHWRSMLKEEVMDPWNHSYIYVNPGKHNATSYDVYSSGPDGQKDTDDDIGNWKSVKSTP